MGEVFSEEGSSLHRDACMGDSKDGSLAARWSRTILGIPLPNVDAYESICHQCWRVLGLVIIAAVQVRLGLPEAPGKYDNNLHGCSSP